MATEQSVIAVIRASRPAFRGPHDKVVYALHASFLAAGYVLTATGSPAFADDALASTSTDEVGIDGWNESEDFYAFSYLNPKSKRVLVKCVAINDFLAVDALEEGDSSEPLHLEINVKDYVAEDGGSNYSSLFKDLGKLVDIFNKDLKLGAPPTSNSNTTPSSSKTRGSGPDMVLPDVRVVEPPQPYNPSGYFVPPVYPGIGGNDLIPNLGAGMYPSRGDFGTGGGSLVGPDHPVFTGGVGRPQPGFPGHLPPGVPPGARFSPYGPPDVPGFEPNRFIRNPRRSDGHPDLEHFRDDAFI